MTVGQAALATLRTAGGVLLLCAATAGGTALVVQAGLSPAIRRLIPIDSETIVEPSLLVILSHNLPLAGLLFVLAARTSTPMVRGFADALIALGAAVNLLLAGAIVGAWGLPTLRILAVYGSLELAGFSVAIAHYWRSRSGQQLATLHDACVTACLLVLAAYAESA